MKQPKRAFRGVWIPAEIWLSADLSITEKCILTEIDSLDNEDGCIAGNKYFSDFFGIKDRQIRNHIAALRDKGYIQVIPISRTRRRIVMSKKFRKMTAINDRHDGRKVPSYDGNKLPHSNTVSNTFINTESVKKLSEMKRGFAQSSTLPRS